MRDAVGVKPEPLHFHSRALVVLLGYRGGEKKLCLPLGRVPFHRHDHCWANQNAVLSRFSRDQTTFLDAIALPEFGRHDDRATLTYFDRFDHLNVSISDVLQNGAVAVDVGCDRQDDRSFKSATSLHKAHEYPRNRS